MAEIECPMEEEPRDGVEAIVPLKKPIAIRGRDWVLDVDAELTRLRTENADLRRERDALVKAQSDWRGK